jgi:hypothetical protein
MTLRTSVNKLRAEITTLEERLARRRTLPAAVRYMNDPQEGLDEFGAEPWDGVSTFEIGTSASGAHRAPPPKPSGGS